jgi:hypothetical protein
MNKYLITFVIVAMFVGIGFYIKTPMTHLTGDVLSPGQNTYTISSTTLVGTSDTWIQSSTTRQYCRFTNIGSSTIFIALMGDAPAVMSNGIALPSLGTWQMTNVDLSLYRGAIHAIATSSPAFLAWSCI